MEKIKFAIEIAKFLVYLYSVIKALVLEIESLIPESGKGAEKFNIVKNAIINGGRIAGFTEEITDAAEQIIDRTIDQTVALEINGD